LHNQGFGPPPDLLNANSPPNMPELHPRLGVVNMRPIGNGRERSDQAGCLWNLFDEDKKTPREELAALNSDEGRF
jgi:hypothetical protein